MMRHIPLVSGVPLTVWRCIGGSSLVRMPTEEHSTTTTTTTTTTEAMYVDQKRQMSPPRMKKTTARSHSLFLYVPPSVRPLVPVRLWYVATWRWSSCPCLSAAPAAP